MSNVYSFSVKKRRELDAEFDKPSKGTEPTKGLYLKKKLWEDEKDKIGNVVSSANTDKVQYFSCDTQFFFLSYACGILYLVLVNALILDKN
jgi:hypothetical protein